ncbi:uncharacterized protein AMSG_12102 [Thecamonas trahens ATCC 50062]|uniref:Uncharacterized protein n=1 Tax=Thecamonas trahens ATCC 50062 TaxID=461836 RepID=A0A0L0DK43_THETB|nr:hypothetical protein AMSG_12102 [Thecamonas trahens ATCC 50062]KNC51733.1 hypothetical protein AMSG_12102 [Thecamonas trahens ATCC 50062]|eukprot:XP_013755903.1 hypothetical protein AMSG_12102 [Thecamonas trahens ATCC 50062]
MRSPRRRHRLVAYTSGGRGGAGLAEHQTTGRARRSARRSAKDRGSLAGTCSGKRGGERVLRLARIGAQACGAPAAGGRVSAPSRRRCGFARDREPRAGRCEQWRRRRRRRRSVGTRQGAARGARSIPGESRPTLCPRVGPRRKSQQFAVRPASSGPQRRRGLYRSYALRCGGGGPGVQALRRAPQSRGQRR